MRLSLQILGYIGNPPDDYDYSYTTAEEVIESINKSSDLDAIDLYIDSIGGNANQGEKMIRAIEGADVPVTVYLEEIAASMASYISVYFYNRGSEVFLSPNLQFMYHAARSSTSGQTARELFDLAEAAQEFDEKMAAEYSKAFDKSDEETLDEMQSDVWLTTSDLIEMGFGKMYEGNEKLAAVVDNEDIYGTLNKRQKQKQDNMADLTKIAAALDLDLDASESIIASKAKDLKAALEAKKDEFDAVKAEKDSLEAKLEAAEKTVSELENKTAESEASVLVAKFEGELERKLADKDEVKGRATRFALRAVQGEDQEKEDATEALKSYIKAHGAPTDKPKAEREGDNLDGVEAVEKLEAKAKEEGIPFSEAFKKYGLS